MRAHAVAGASPPPPASCISVAISHADAMCSATERRYSAEGSVNSNICSNTYISRRVGEQVCGRW
eukprot:scaffold25508_cov69-Phaeocystis_antarctica.AAC.2